MPRRKGYGIPPTKRIKIENENDENEPSDNKSENTHENCISNQAPTSASENISNKLANATTNGSNKYLHKKFKKMVAILSDDCAPSIEANDNEQRESNRDVVPSMREPYNVTPPSVPLPTTTEALVNHREPSSIAVTQSSLPEYVPRIDAYSVANRDQSTARLSKSPITTTASLYNAAQIAATVAVGSTSVQCNTFTTTVTAVVEDDNAVPAIIGRYACPYCKLVCNKPSVLQKHIRAHTNERPYPCLPCGFAFKTRSNLYKHCRSRSHSLKMEETGVDGNTKMYEEEPEEDDDDSQTPSSLKDDSSNDENKTESIPRTSIYKPKFHKAAIYIQNNNAATTSSSKIENNSMNKLGLQLKIPSTSATSGTQNSTPSTPSPFTSGSSPSPEFLHRHISKLISENQAIVETTDPFWSKKFYQRKEGSPSSPLSTSSSSSLDSYKKIPIKQEPQSIEDKLPVESKLAHALLQPRVTKAAPISEPVIEDAQPLNLTISKDTRARSYPDELEDDKTAEHIVTNHEMKFVPNGRIVPEIHPNSIPVKNKIPIMEHMCSLCDETFDNYDKLKQHILYQCKGNKNHSLSKPDPMRVYVKVPETKSNPNQSPGPRLGNTPLIGNYKKLSVITPLTQDKMKTVDQKCITSLKSLEELSNAPMKGNQYVYNAALVSDEKLARVEYARNDTKNSVIMSKTDEQKVIVKTTSILNKAKELDTSTTKTTSNTPKISQFVIPFVQGVPNLASIQGVPAIITVTTNSGGNIHALTPIAATYKSATALPVNTIPKTKFAHVNGEVVTINYGGKVIPHVPGMPGPQSMGPAFVHVDGFEKKETVKRKCEDGPINGMIRSHNQRMDEAQVPKTLHGVKIKEESVIYADQDKDSSSGAVKFARPSSLPLKPGTFVPKKLQPGTSSVLPLISPETPRPNKSYGQLYIGGNAYTYLGLKCSTRSTFCTLHKSQPTYVPLSPEHNKVSMYSNWKIRSDVDPYLRGVPPTKAMSCYDSRQRYSSYTVVHTKMKDAVTHSSYWFNRSKASDQGDLKQSPDDDKENNIQNELHGRNDDASKNSKICLGGIESTDEYTYIRGRGRGKYVCLECGIRCRKPSMLKKHIRTHTDVRPYICKHCVFSFKTKGNLTKHMKSKAHYKKCIELGIVPVPTVVDDSYVDEEILSKQAQQIEDGQDIEETEEEDDDDDDDDDDENDDDFVEDKEAVEDPKCQLEREVARSLLSLSKMSHQTVSEQYANAGLVPLNARPNTYPYNFSANSHLSSKPHTPTLTLFSEQKEQEKVSKNTGLARELQPVTTCHQLVKPKSETQATERYYFGSTDKEIVSMETNDVPETSPKEQSFGKNSFVDRAAKMETDRGSDSDSKENLVVTPTDNEKAESSTSVIISVGSPNSNTSANSPKKLQAEFISPCSGPLTKYASVLEDGRSKCVVCNKIFSKPSQLRLHVNIHYFEQPFRCESCAVSFRTKGHLHKHLGSNSHLNKVSMNSATGGQTSSNNPRPFKCDDCNIGFRIHGHLAKHLRSKMHIMKLECLGKLPFGTYAEMERCGINMNDIDTTDCENSLESLQRIAKGVVNSVMYVNSGDEDNKMSTDSSF